MAPSLSVSLPSLSFSQSARAAITSYSSLVAYTKMYFLRVLEAGKTKNKVLADLVPGEDPPS